MHDAVQILEIAGQPGEIKNSLEEGEKGHNSDSDRKNSKTSSSPNNEPVDQAGSKIEVPAQLHEAVS